MVKFNWLLKCPKLMKYQRFRFALVKLQSHVDQAPPQLAKFKQKKREVQCAVNLAQKLQQYVDGDISGFERAVDEEAEELSRSAFGGVLLNLIGTIYMEQGRAELGGLGGLGVNLSQTNRYIGTRYAVPRSRTHTFLDSICSKRLPKVSSSQMMLRKHMLDFKRLES